MSSWLLCAPLLALAQFREPWPVVLRPTHECWPSAVDGPSYDLVLDIAVGGSALRLGALRETWAGPAVRDGMACSVINLFVHAAPAAAVHHRRVADEVFLFLNTTDTYERLPVKVLGSLQWLSAHVHFKYVLKTDDDAWICTHSLLETLAAFPRSRLYWAKMNTRHALISGVVHRASSGSFVHSAFTDYFRGATHYSTYAFGAAYVLSHDVAAMMGRLVVAANAQSRPALIQPAAPPRCHVLIVERTMPPCAAARLESRVRTLHREISDVCAQPTRTGARAPKRARKASARRPGTRRSI
ncbi:hypothetical protein T492DRAFT_1144173 [Pavlovales sp. CCMP2436]|nr:hypothetical protein T492DRAFT_1144173 [Pavlovales sp. CCMP2436]